MTDNLYTSSLQTKHESLQIKVVLWDLLISNIWKITECKRFLRKSRFYTKHIILQ